MKTSQYKQIGSRAAAPRRNTCPNVNHLRKNKLMRHNIPEFSKLSQHLLYPFGSHATSGLLGRGISIRFLMSTNTFSLPRARAFYELKAFHVESIAPTRLHGGSFRKMTSSATVQCSKRSLMNSRLVASVTIKFKSTRFKAHSIRFNLHPEPNALNISSNKRMSCFPNLRTRIESIQSK